MTVGCAITAWGAALPSTEVTNQDLTSRLDTTDEWIIARSGIRTRRTAAGPFAKVDSAARDKSLGTTGALAVECGLRALSASTVSPSAVRFLILCTTTPDLAVPATSAAVAGALGITGGAMDLNAACSGFTYGLVTAASMISAGMGPILLIGAETLSRVTNWNDRTNAFLFGDGAGAILLEPTSGRESLLGWNVGVDGSLIDLLYAEHGSGIVMRGNEVFRKAVRATVHSARAALDHAKVDVSDIALFVPHQANKRIMDAAAAQIGISADSVASIIERTGNTSAASIPLTLIDAAERGRLKSGDLVLLAGFGAGMTWASAVWRW